MRLPMEKVEGEFQKTALTLRSFLLSFILFVPLLSISQHTVTGRVVCCNTMTPILSIDVSELNAFSLTSVGAKGEFGLVTTRDSVVIVISGSGNSGILYEEVEILVVSDTTLDLCLNTSGVIYELIDMRGRKWLTLGFSFDFTSGMVGVTFGNGLDERALIHFEDISNKLLFKGAVQSDFNENYAFTGALAIRNSLAPIDPRLMFRHHHFPKHVHSYNSLIFTTGFRMKPGFVELILNVAGGYQTLNKYSNPGGQLGLECALHSLGMHFGVTHGYWSDYSTWQLFMKGFLIKNRLTAGVNWEQINLFKMLNVSLTFLIPRGD